MIPFNFSVCVFRFIASDVILQTYNSKWLIIFRDLLEFFVCCLLAFGLDLFDLLLLLAVFYFYSQFLPYTFPIISLSFPK